MKHRLFKHYTLMLLCLCYSSAVILAKEDKKCDVQKFIDTINSELQLKTQNFTDCNFLMVVYNDSYLTQWKTNSFSFKDKYLKYVEEVSTAAIELETVLEKHRSDIDTKKYMTGEYLYNYMTCPAVVYLDIKNDTLKNRPSTYNHSTESAYSYNDIGTTVDIPRSHTYKQNSFKNTLGVEVGLSVNKIGAGYFLGVEYNAFVRPNLALYCGAAYYGQSRKNNMGFIENTDEYQYQWTGSPEFYKKTSLNGLSIPVGLKYYIPNKKNDIKMFVSAGGDLSYGFSMKEKISAEEGRNIYAFDNESDNLVTYSYSETKNLFTGRFATSFEGPDKIYNELHSVAGFDENTYKRLDVRLSIGFGVQIGEICEIKATYKYGFLNPSGYPLNNIFCIGFKFNIIK